MIEDKLKALMNSLLERWRKLSPTARVVIVFTLALLTAIGVNSPIIALFLGLFTGLYLRRVVDALP